MVVATWKAKNGLRKCVSGQLNGRGERERERENTSSHNKIYLRASDDHQPPSPPSPKRAHKRQTIKKHRTQHTKGASNPIIFHNFYVVSPGARNMIDIYIICNVMWWCRTFISLRDRNQSQLTQISIVCGLLSNRVGCREYGPGQKKKRKKKWLQKWPRYGHRLGHFATPGKCLRFILFFSLSHLRLAFDEFIGLLPTGKTGCTFSIQLG